MDFLKIPKIHKMEDNTWIVTDWNYAYIHIAETNQAFIIEIVDKQLVIEPRLQYVDIDELIAFFNNGEKIVSIENCM